MQDDKTDIKDRLKASELLGKPEADFVDRKRQEGGVDVDVFVAVPEKLSIEEWKKRYA